MSSSIFSLLKIYGKKSHYIMAVDEYDRTFIDYFVFYSKNHMYPDIPVFESATFSFQIQNFPVHT